MRTELYTDALPHWPDEGRHIVAQHDADSILVYHAYNPHIAAAAVAHQKFGGGGFGLGRMSWIKPNFLWMMYRCGWATKPNQERVLAIRLSRAVFRAIVEDAVLSAFDPGVHETEAAWQARVANSDIRVQWDPDHAPDGSRVARRAVQLGLRGAALHAFATEWPLEITDVTAFVEEQRVNVGTPALMVPVERVVGGWALRVPTLDGEMVMDYTRVGP